MAYCRNCGKELAPQAAVCVGCGVRPPRGNRFCQNCGNQVEPLAEICVRCGVRLATAQATGRRGKNKTASVLLAVFLAFWTWLYTYRRNAWKFWVGVGVTVAQTAFSIVAMMNIANASLYLWGDVWPDGGAIPSLDPAVLWWMLGMCAWGFVQFGIWVWAIVDVAVKDNEWYQSY